MRPHLPLLAALLLSSHIAPAQTLQPPCSFSGFIQFGICIDPPGCLILGAEVSGGILPYQYQWSTGSVNASTVFSYPNIPTNLCVQVTVTDAAGCMMEMATLASWPSSGPVLASEPGFLLPDTLIGAGPDIPFDLGENDNPQAQGYRVVDQPRHGLLTLQPDGTGQYTCDPGYCGPDYFRYTATDTSNCVLAPIVTVDILNGPCAGILLTRLACNDVCDATAVFYEQGALTPPLTYSWSNAMTGDTATGLCAGVSSLTVTDGLGAAHVYSVNVPASGLSVQIQGPTQACQGSEVALSPILDTLNAGSMVHYSWSGEGVNPSYNGHQEALNVYLPSSQVDTISLNPYELIVRSAAGCADTVTYLIEASPPISPGTVQLGAPVCPHDTLFLKIDPTRGSPPFSYAWSGPYGIQSNYKDLVWPDLSPAAGGNYRVTITDIRGCTSIRSKNVAVPDSCAIQVYIFPSTNNPFCKGQDIALSYSWGGGFPTFQPDHLEWHGPDGFFSTENNPVLTNVDPAQTGVYTLSLFSGANVYTGERTITIADYAAEVLDLTIVSPPTHCQLPDGVISVTMSSPPPYDVAFTWGSGFPVQNANPFTANGVRAGDSYRMTVTTNGCRVEYPLLIPYPAEPEIVATDVTCLGNDGTAMVVSPNPVRVNWSGPNNLNIINDPAIEGLAPATYYVSVRDSVTKCEFLYQPVAILPYLLFDITALQLPSCTGAAGILQAVELGLPVLPVTWSWSNGFTGNPSAGLAYGGYSVTMTDGQGCQRHENVVLPASEPCFGRISGRVYLNSDCICVADTNDYAYPFVRVCVTNGVYSDCVYTDYTGAYEVVVTDPGAYTVQAVSYNSFAQPACASQTLTIPAIPFDTIGRDLFFCAPPVLDLSLAGYCSPARPGFYHNLSLHVHNQGTLPVDTAFLTVQIDPQIDIAQVTPTPLLLDFQTNQITWLVEDLPINSQFNAQVVGTVDAMLGDTISHSGVLTTAGTDVQPDDNSFACERVVQGSVDPNDKTVNPLGAGPGGELSLSDSVLTYTIRFQNTGTDTAFLVVIRDTLDAFVFAVDRVRPLASSHPYRLDVEGDHILVFYFENILLPDSNRSLAGSQGYVVFSVPLLPQLPPATPIRNNAAIYFDYNDPVITNTAVNIVTAAAAPERLLPRLRVFPNPAYGQVQVAITLPAAVGALALDLVDVNGRVVKTIYRGSAQAGELVAPVGVGNLGAGIYFVRGMVEGGVVGEKVVVIN